MGDMFHCMVVLPRGGGGRWEPHRDDGLLHFLKSDDTGPPVNEVYQRLKVKKEGNE